MRTTFYEEELKTLEITASWQVLCNILCRYSLAGLILCQVRCFFLLLLLLFIIAQLFSSGKGPFASSLSKVFLELQTPGSLIIARTTLNEFEKLFIVHFVEFLLIFNMRPFFFYYYQPLKQEKHASNIQRILSSREEARKSGKPVVLFLLLFNVANVMFVKKK